ncbi:MAG: hypothetical protein AAFV29_26175, partial [Myxococcota bacterium]
MRSTTWIMGGAAAVGLATMGIVAALVGAASSTPQHRAPAAAEPTTRASSGSDAKADRATALPATTAGRRTAERMVEARRLDQ